MMKTATLMACFTIQVLSKTGVGGGGIVVGVVVLLLVVV